MGVVQTLQRVLGERERKVVKMVVLGVEVVQTVGVVGGAVGLRNPFVYWRKYEKRTGPLDCSSVAGMGKRAFRAALVTGPWGIRTHDQGIMSPLL